MKSAKDAYLEAIAKIEKFSPAPRVLGRATKLLADPNADLGEIGELIRTDLALTTDIIRGANSAYYGGGERVSSLDRAMQKVGFRECLRLLNLSVARTLSGSELSCYGIGSEEYWAESLFNGLFMEFLAKRAGVIDTDTAHTTGLLRFIGRLAINRALVDLGAGIFWDGQSPVHEWELSQIGFTHTQAAGYLLRAWQFSDEIIRAIEWQDSLSQAPVRDGLLEALNFCTFLLPHGANPATLQPVIDQAKATPPPSERRSRKSSRPRSSNT
jgi:HD-like signal output (HDOD) protein